MKPPNLLNKRMNSELKTFSQLEARVERLDLFLVRNLPGFSRSRLQALIKDGQVLIDGLVVSKMSTPVTQGQRVDITLPPPEPSELIPEHIPLDIVYEDEHLLIVNKPAGMVVHPAAGHSTGTLVHAVLAHAPGLRGVGGVQRPGMVHRLDKDTSGLILLAKDDETHRWLQNQFKQREVNKTYITLVDGEPPTLTGRIEAPIGRDPSKRKQMAVVPDTKGRSAVSEYRVLRRYGSHSLVEVHPLTGRTHQIRVHMAFIGCPVVGDKVYGHKKPSLPLKRHFLHARDLEVCFPGEDQPRTFSAPLPPELEAVLQALEISLA
ncbi:MAG TPA: RluA family pseudouridine synthase [Anaerolineaceae bacterium]|nr:RluA family pseudouridine synthase [Anaerolineaceae bacterium]HQN05594.1 RluA family pseudouridine synthase [Anaerolineaceae bacterium]HQP08853.1 RluA family pseudouridine synthase [Anaerolineaceae bacterium]